MSDWFQIRTPMDVTHDTTAAWQHERTGLVVAVRELRGSRYVIETFPENYHDDKQPIDRHRDVRSHRDNALAAARDVMDEVA